MNRSSVSESNGYRTYSKVSEEDWAWVIEQEPSVQQLWLECMKAEKFGESFNVLETKLSRHSFEKAKKIIEKTKRFEFEPINRKTKAGRYKITGWKVRNLHGSKVKPYWSSDSALVGQNLDKEETTEDTNLSLSNKWTTNVQNLDDVGQQMDKEKPVAFDTTAFDSPLLSKNNLSIISELSSENRSGRFVGSSPLGGEAAYTSGASDIVEEESGATHKSENLGRSEPCRTSSESENEHRREEAESTHQPKSSVPPRTISPQSNVQLFEDELQGASNQAEVQSDSEMLRSAIETLPATHKKVIGSFCYWLAVKQDRGDYAKQLLPLMDILGRTDVEVLNAAILEMKPRVERNERIGSFGMHFSLAIANNSKQ